MLGASFHGGYLSYARSGKDTRNPADSVAMPVVGTKKFPFPGPYLGILATIVLAVAETVRPLQYLGNKYMLTVQ